MNVLVVGGEGYIGKVLCNYLISKSNYVRSYDNLIYGHYNQEKKK